MLQQCKTTESNIKTLNYHGSLNSIRNYRELSNISSQTRIIKKNSQNVLRNSSNSIQYDQADFPNLNYAKKMEDKDLNSSNQLIKDQNSDLEIEDILNKPIQLKKNQSKLDYLIAHSKLYINDVSHVTESPNESQHIEASYTPPPQPEVVEVPQEKNAKDLIQELMNMNRSTQIKMMEQQSEPR